MHPRERRVRRTCRALAYGLVFLPIANIQAQATGLVFTDSVRLRAVPYAYFPYSGAALPGKVDLRPLMPVPGQQGKQNSCVGWAVAYGLKTYEERVEEQLPLVSSDNVPIPSRHFSPAFIYNQIVIGADKGAAFFDALQLVATSGVATLAEMKYVDSDFKTKPSAAVRKKALRYRIDGWKQIGASDHLLLKAYLDAQYPILIGADVDEGFLKLQGDFVWRAPSGAPKGGHAMLVVGYDDARRAFMVLNSWGDKWADGGYGWIDYEYFPRVVREAFIVRDAVNPPLDVDAMYRDIYGPLRRSSVIGDVTVPATASREAVLGITRVRVDSAAAGGDSIVTFDGSVSIPPGTSGRAQIVVQLYELSSEGTRGARLHGRSVRFTTVDSAVAAPAEAFIISPQGSLQLPWTARVPVDALDLSGEDPLQPSVRLLAVPVLFINQFGVKEGQSMIFEITRKII